MPPTPPVRHARIQGEGGCLQPEAAPQSASRTGRHERVLLTPRSLSDLNQNNMLSTYLSVPRHTHAFICGHANLMSHGEALRYYHSHSYLANKETEATKHVHILNKHMYMCIFFGVAGTALMRVGAARLSADDRVIH